MAKRKFPKIAPIEISDFASRVVADLRKKWVTAISIIFGPSIFEFIIGLLKDYLWSKAMDSFISKLGEFGLWLTSYKLAWITLGVIIFLGWLSGTILKDAYTERQSLIVNLHGQPYTIRKTSRRMAYSFLITCAAIIAVLASGVVAFYRYTPDVLLEKYPLGYVIFKNDIRNEKFPFAIHDLLDKYDFNWNAVRVEQTSPDFLKIYLPDITERNGGVIVRQNSIGTPKKVGPFKSRGLIRFGVENIELHGEIIKIQKNGIIFLFGFKESPHHQAAVSFLYSMFGDAMSLRTVSLNKYGFF